MARIGKKIVDLSEFGYEQPVVFKELTMGDAADITGTINIENKRYEGNIPEVVLNMIVLEKLIESAPFGADRESLRALPLTVGLFLLEQAQSILDPLVKRMSKTLNTTTEEVGHPTLNTQN